jgi:hypothetical protein
MARARSVAPAMLVAAALIVAGCGAGAHSSTSHSSAAHAQTKPRRQATPQSSQAAPATPPPPGAGHSADGRTVAVIHHWADALRRGDVHAAARLFQIPSVFAPGPDQEVTIHSLAEAEAANATLPCGAKLISVVRVGGPLVQALFRLTGRPGRGGSACNPGAGQTARTNFVIRSGRIRVWLRAPDAPGDNPAQPSPDGSGGGGPVV